MVYTYCISCWCHTEFYCLSSSSMFSLWIIFCHPTRILVARNGYIRKTKFNLVRNTPFLVEMTVRFPLNPPGCSQFVSRNSQSGGFWIGRALQWQRPCPVEQTLQHLVTRRSDLSCKKRTRCGNHWLTKSTQHHLGMEIPMKNSRTRTIFLWCNILEQKNSTTISKMNKAFLLQDINGIN